MQNEALEAYATVVGGTTGALKLFRIALASTGIGLVTVALGALIANFEAALCFVLLNFCSCFYFMFNSFSTSLICLHLLSNALHDPGKQEIITSTVSPLFITTPLIKGNGSEVKNLV